VSTILYSDDDFTISTGTVNSVRRCLHVQPGVIDFPGRCKREPGHTGPHEGAVLYVGTSSAGLFPPIKWENTGE
jgi:hypothetical protein